MVKWINKRKSVTKRFSVDFRPKNHLNPYGRQHYFEAKKQICITVMWRFTQTQVRFSVLFNFFGVLVGCHCSVLKSPIIQSSFHSHYGLNLICVVFEVLWMVLDKLFCPTPLLWMAYHTFDAQPRCIPTEFSGNVNAVSCLALASSLKNKPLEWNGATTKKQDQFTHSSERRKNGMHIATKTIAGKRMQQIEREWVCQLVRYIYVSSTIQ